MEKYKQLEQKAKDCGVFYGIYSKEYAKAVHEMNDYWLENLNPEPKLTLKEKFSIKYNSIKNKLRYGN